MFPEDQPCPKDGGPGGQAVGVKHEEGQGQGCGQGRQRDEAGGKQDEEEEGDPHESPGEVQGQGAADERGDPFSPLPFQEDREHVPADSGSPDPEGADGPLPEEVDGQENGKKGLEDVQEGCAESQEEATLPQDVGAADVSASLGPDVLPLTPVIKKVTVGNRGQQVGPRN